MALFQKAIVKEMQWSTSLEMETIPQPLRLCKGWPPFRMHVGGCSGWGLICIPAKAVVKDPCNRKESNTIFVFSNIFTLPRFGARHMKTYHKSVASRNEVWQLCLHCNQGTNNCRYCAMQRVSCTDPLEGTVQLFVSSAEQLSRMIDELRCRSYNDSICC